MSDRRRLAVVPTVPIAELYGDPRYPGHGYPPRPGEDRPALSPFGRLAMGQTLGKSSILIYDKNVCSPQPSAVNMITVEGDDVDAWQLILTLHPPRVIPLSTEEVLARLDTQNLTGEQTNNEVAADHFPGSGEPIKWPPLEALIEFGVGGVSTEVAVDYVNGVTLSLVASYLRVRAVVTQNRDNGDISGTSAAYYLAAHVGPGYSGAFAQRTIFAGVVEDQHGSDIFDVPKFARRVQLVGCCPGQHDHCQPPSHMIGWIRFFQDPCGRHCVGEFFVEEGRLRRFDIPNAAPYFSVFNASKNPKRMSAIFELAL